MYTESTIKNRYLDKVLTLFIGFWFNTREEIRMTACLSKLDYLKEHVNYIKIDQQLNNIKKV